MDPQGVPLESRSLVVMAARELLPNETNAGSTTANNT